MKFFRLLPLALAFIASAAFAQVSEDTTFSPNTAYNWGALQTFNAGISTSAVNGVQPLYNVRDDSGVPANIVTGGTGYSTGDLLSVVGGVCTTPPVIAAFQTAGVTTGFYVSNRGVCSTPPTNPVSVTGGSGSGATFNLAYAPISTATTFAPFSPGAGNQNGIMVLGQGAGTNNQGGMLGLTGYGFQCCGSGQNTVDGLGGGTGITAAAAEDTFIGYNTGTQVTSGQWLTYMGHNAGGHETIGNFQVVIGTDAGKFLNNGTEIAAVGRNTLKFMLNPSNVAVFGSGAATGGQFSTNVSGAANNGSGLCRVTVSSTTSMLTGDTAVVTGIVGATACNGVWPNSTIVDATHIDLTGSSFAGSYTSGGAVADYASFALARTVAVGTNSLSGSGLRSIGRLVAVGTDTLKALTTGTDDTAVGEAAGNALTTGVQDTFLGGFAGDTATNGNGDVIAGYKADVTASNASNAVIIGGTASGGGNGARGTDSSTVVGAKAGSSSMTGTKNSVFGYQAGNGITSGVDDLVLGTGAAACNPSSGTVSSTITICAGSASPVFSATGGGTPSTSASTVAGTLKISGGYTVSTLPASPGTGARAYVTDATACTLLGALVGGGSTFCPTIYNGSAWVGGA